MGRVSTVVKTSLRIREYRFTVVLQYINEKIFKEKRLLLFEPLVFSSEGRSFFTFPFWTVVSLTSLLVPNLKQNSLAP